MNYYVKELCELFDLKSIQIIFLKTNMPHNADFFLHSLHFFS